MFTDDQLKLMAREVKYEIDEFRSSYSELPKVRGKAEWNRTLESVLLHFRVLRAFFFSEGHNKDSDVFAKYYVPQWKPKRDPVFDRTKTAIDKWLAHLTIERLDPKEKWKDLDQMSAAIETLLVQFMAALPASSRPWFAGAIVDTHPMPLLGEADNSTATVVRHRLL